MARKPKPPMEFAPRPPIFPFGARDLAIMARWTQEGRKACGTCVAFDVAAPINDRGICYCNDRKVWTAPQWGDDCPNHKLKESDDGRDDGDHLDG